MSFPGDLLERILENEIVYIAIKKNKYKILGVYNDLYAAKLKILESLSEDNFNIDYYDPQIRYVKMNIKWFPRDVDEFQYEDLWNNLELYNDYEIHLWKKNKEKLDVLYFNINRWIIEHLNKLDETPFEKLKLMVHELQDVIDRGEIPNILNKYFSEKKFFFSNTDDNPHD